ncbi:MAG: carboxypeptidase-like regulatory domain-containing protein [Thermoplasmata archaeon]
MKVYKFYLLIILFLFLMPVSYSHRVQILPGADTYISGVVLNSNNNTSIQGALVEILYNGTIVRQGNTNFTGGFEFAVPTGIYVIQVSKPGFQSNSTTVAVSAQQPGTGIIIYLTPSQSTSYTPIYFILLGSAAIIVVIVVYIWYEKEKKKTKKEYKESTKSTKICPICKQPYTGSLKVHIKKEHRK